jgi:hypothetical protein
VRLVAKFPGTCRQCRRRFEVGTAIEWNRVTGSIHAIGAECGPTPEAEPEPVQDSASIVAFLAAAQVRGLKFPKARFLAPNGAEMRLSLASARSQVPGAIQVVVADLWIGRICPDGRVEGELVHRADLLTTLATIALDPAKAAKEYGALMGRCSFCNLALTDAGSIEVGYGPVCAKSWGLPHRPKGTPALLHIPTPSGGHHAAF